MKNNKYIMVIPILLMFISRLMGFDSNPADRKISSSIAEYNLDMSYSGDSKAWNVIDDPVFEGLSHGFGLGERTIVEGWIDRAVVFWKNRMK